MYTILSKNLCPKISSSRTGPVKENYKNSHYECTQLSQQKGITNGEKGNSSLKQKWQQGAQLPPPFPNRCSKVKNGSNTSTRAKNVV